MQRQFWHYGLGPGRTCGRCQCVLNTYCLRCYSCQSSVFCAVNTCVILCLIRSQTVILNSKQESAKLPSEQRRRVVWVLRSTAETISWLVDSSIIAWNELTILIIDCLSHFSKQKCKTFSGSSISNVSICCFSLLYIKNCKQNKRFGYSVFELWGIIMSMFHYF